MAELGVHGILLQVDLLHGVHGRRIAGFLRHHGWRPVQHNIVLRAGAAAHVQLRSRPVMKRILLGGGADHHRGIQGSEQERIAVDDRQRVGHLGIERQPHGRGIELHRDRRCFHGNRFIGIADFQPRIDGDIAAGLHQHVLLHKSAEAR